MRSNKPVPRRFPRAPLERRIYAYALDLFVVWLLSALVGIALLQLLVFVGGWFAMRVFVVSRYRGQSLGRWAFDLVLVDADRGRIPDLMTLSKREGIAGGAAFLAIIGLQFGLPNAFSAVLLAAPLGADLVIALADEDYQQAFHDRFANTLVVPSRRGYSLDLRLKRWTEQLLTRVRDREREREDDRDLDDRYY